MRLNGEHMEEGRDSKHVKSTVFSGSEIEAEVEPSKVIGVLNWLWRSRGPSIVAKIFV